MNQGKAQADGQRGKALRCALVGRREDDEQFVVCAGGILGLASGCVPGTVRVRFMKHLVRVVWAGLLVALLISLWPVRAEPLGPSSRRSGLIAYDRSQLGFTPNPAGGTLYLVSPDRRRVLDAVRYGGQARGIATGRSVTTGARPTGPTATRAARAIGPTSSSRAFATMAPGIR
jgi:hypothetical protein